MPGRTPRHPEGAFEALRLTVGQVQTPEMLARCDAWRAGWQYLRTGYFWEAHEVWEPVWMALTPGSEDRQLVKAVIQLANAGLKARMGRPRAVRRLCDLAEAHLSASGDAAGRLGVDTGEIRARLAALREGAIP